MGLLWLFFCITEDSAEAKGAFSLRALTRLTRVTRDARTENAPIYQLRQLWSIRPALSADNVKMLVHAFVASRVDYCNSILYQVAAVHLRSLQSVLNATTLLVVEMLSLIHISEPTRPY